MHWQQKRQTELKKRQKGTAHNAHNVHNAHNAHTTHPTQEMTSKRTVLKRSNRQLLSPPQPLLHNPRERCVVEPQHFIYFTARSHTAFQFLQHNITAHREHIYSGGWFTPRV